MRACVRVCVRVCVRHARASLPDRCCADRPPGLTACCPAQITHPSGLSDKRIGRNAALNDKYTVRFVNNSPDVVRWLAASMRVKMSVKKWM